MIVSRIMRWVARWLEKRGLGSVADTLDRRTAEAGNVEATRMAQSLSWKERR